MTIQSPYGYFLPIFPSLDYAAIDADRVERTAERLMDRADKALMEGRASQVQYDKWVRALNEWADAHYAKVGR